METTKSFYLYKSDTFIAHTMRKELLNRSLEINILIL